MAMGFEFAGAVLVASFIGFWIDRWLGTSPWCLIGGMVLGFATGVYGMIKVSGKNGGAGK